MLDRCLQGDEKPVQVADGDCRKVEVQVWLIVDGSGSWSHDEL